MTVRQVFVVLALLWLGSGSGPALAEQDPEARGWAIAVRWAHHDNGFGDSQADVTMILENRHGQTSHRAMRMKTLEVPGDDDGDKSLIVFDQPRDVRGTAFLTFAHILEPDDQWLYLPALKRVKRISSANKSGPFVGSEFSYEDIAARELKKYTYRWLRQEPCGDRVCDVVEQVPTYKRSGYTRRLVWFDTTDFQERRVDFYDRKNKLFKRLTLNDYQQYLGHVWRAQDLFMENVQTGKKTRLLFKNVRYKTGLSSRDFNRTSLRRAR